jgi:uncharacterized lipoprotein YmbA
MNLHAHSWVALAAAALLAACGGGHGTVEVLGAVPASATAAPDAFTRYVAALPEDEQREPLNVDGLVPPTSEMAEPEPITR